MPGKKPSRRDLVLEYIESVPYSPTLRELQEAVGLASPSTVQKHLARLERDGLVARGGPARDRIYPLSRAK